MTGPGEDGSVPVRSTDPPGRGARSEHSTRTTRFAWGAVVVILIAVVALVLYALAGTPASSGVVHRSPASSAVMTELGTVPTSVFDAVGIRSTTPLVVPTVLSHQPPLAAGGRPEVLFVGAEYCPFCAAERWPLIVALSRFGRFTALDNMQSAPQSVFPALQSFTFVGTAYTSRYVSFTGLELYSDSVDGDGVFTRIATLDPDQAALLDRYDDGVPSGPGSIPFVDIDNTMVTSTSGFSPATLVGHPQAAIAGSLTETGAPIGQAIVASANYLTAGICRATGQQPPGVCDSRGVRSADAALGPG